MNTKRIDTYNRVKELLEGWDYLVITYIEGEPELTVEYRRPNFTRSDQSLIASAVRRHLSANGLLADYNYNQTSVFVRVYL